MITLALTAFLACGHAEDSTEFETYLPENESFVSTSESNARDTVNAANTVVPENIAVTPTVAATSTQHHPVPVSDHAESDKEAGEDTEETPPKDVAPKDVEAFRKAKADAKKNLGGLAAVKKTYNAIMNKAPPIPKSTRGLNVYKVWLSQARTSTLELAKLTKNVENEEAGTAIWNVYARLQLDAQHLETRLQSDEVAKEDAAVINEQGQKENDAFYKTEGNKTEDLHFFDTKEEMVQMRDDLHELMRKHNIPHQKLSIEDHNHAISKFIFHTSMRHHETKNDEELAQAFAGRGMTYGETATTKCVQAAIGAVSPKFCWKGGSYNHDFNMRCPSGYYHPSGMAECFQPCRHGYKWAWGGTCWTTCPAHHVETGPTCNRAYWGNCCTHIWAPWGRRRARVCTGCPQVSIVGRSHYWPHRFPFTSDRMQCRHRYSATYSNGDTDLQYQAGAACYRRCDSFVPGKGMTGCGFDACASTSAQCSQAIGNMIFEIAMAVVSIVAIVATAGAAAPAVVATKTAMAAVARKMGSSAAKRLAQQTAKGLRRQTAKSFEKNAWRLAVKRGIKKELKDQVRSTPQTVMENWSQNAIKSYCQAQTLRIYNAANPGSSKTMDPAAWDPTGFANMANKCKAGPEDMDCKAAIVGAAGNFDPTGLMGVAAAFMHKNCESCDSNCRANANKPVVDSNNLYSKKNHLFCDSYGYDGNRYAYHSLASASQACFADPNCGGVKQWHCGSNRYGLCGKAGLTLRNYGSARCVYT